MTTLQTVVAGQTITASWGNNVRDGLVTAFASFAARASAYPTPPGGFTSWLTSIKQLNTFDGTSHVPVQANYVGSASRTANASATSTETIADTVTVTTITGRRYKITWSGAASSSAGGDNYEIRLRAAAGASVTNTSTQVHGALVTGTVANANLPICFATATTTLPAGQVTIGVFVVRTFGAGTITASASSPNPVTLIVEDIGT